MDNLINALPSTGSIVTKWIHKDSKNLDDDSTAVFFTSKADECIDAVVLQQNNEVIAAGWISNFMNLDIGKESESYYIEPGKEKKVLSLLKSYYKSVPDKVRSIIEDTRNTGWIPLVLFNIGMIVFLSFLLFIVVPVFNLLKQNMDLVLTGYVALLMLLNYLLSRRRKETIRSLRRVQCFRIIDEILLCRIYMVADKKYK